MTDRIIHNIPSGEVSTDYSEPTSPPNGIDGARELLIAAGKLESAETLLLDPRPASVLEAEQLLGEAAECIRSHELQVSDVANQANTCAEQAFALQSTLRRLLVLLQGALRVQWHRMRRTGLYIETYTSGGKTKVCVPRNPRLDVKI